LVAWDADRDDWRTFRVDRIEPRPPAGPRFTPRALPPDREIAAEVARRAGEATWQYRARVIVHAPAEYVRNRLPIPVKGDWAAGAGAADVAAADGHPVGQRAGQHAEQFLVAGRAADHEDLRRVLAERVHRPAEVRRQHGLLEPQPDGPPFSGAVVPVERQPAA